MIFCQTIEATILGELLKTLQSSPAGADAEPVGQPKSPTGASSLQKVTVAGIFWNLTLLRVVDGETSGEQLPPGNERKTSA
jgi:hypothetical protein